MPNKTNLMRYKEALTKVNKDDLYYQFITLNKNKEDVCLYFNIGEKVLYKLLNLYNIKKSPEQIKECRNNTKIKIAGSLEKYYKIQAEHYKQTMLDKYGVEAAMQVKEFFDKGKQTKLEKYGDEYYCDFDKMKKTINQKYGVDWYTQSEEFATQFKITCLNKYGVEHSSKVPTILNKVWESKKRNGTTKSSRLEEYCYDCLKEVFDIEDIERQYIEPRYPFHCDFYIKSLDLFIEVNGTWLHGEHEYNPLDKNDVNKLNKIKSKQKIVNGKRNQYFKAEEVWVLEDPHKKSVAKMNNLKYVTLYNKKEIDNFIRYIITEEDNKE